MVVDDASARAICIEASKKTALEYVMVYDMRTGLVIGQHAGEPDGAGFTSAIRTVALDSQYKLKVTHTHPLDGAFSLSPVDLLVLWDYAGIYEIEAVTLDGSWFRARAISQSSAMAKAYINRVFIDLYKICLTVPQHDPLSVEEVRYLHEASTDVCCRALAKREIIEYESNESDQVANGWKPHGALRDELVRLTVARSRMPQRY